MPEPEQVETTVTAILTTTSDDWAQAIHGELADVARAHVGYPSVTCARVELSRSDGQPEVPAPVADAIAEAVAARLEARPRTEAEAAVDRVRALHWVREESGVRRWCVHCSTGLDENGRTTGGSLVRWPCPTTIALDGPPAENGAAS